MEGFMHSGQLSPKLRSAIDVLLLHLSHKHLVLQLNLTEIKKICVVAALCSPTGLPQSSQTDPFSPKRYVADKAPLLTMIWSQRWPIDITLLGDNHRGEAAEFVAVFRNGMVEWFWNVNKSTAGPSDFLFYFSAVCFTLLFLCPSKCLLLRAWYGDELCKI